MNTKTAATEPRKKNRKELPSIKHKNSSQISKNNINFQNLFSL